MSKIFFALMTLKARLEEAPKDRGATAVEYGLLVALIAAVIVTVVFTLGGQINTAFTKVSDQLKAVTP